MQHPQTLHTHTHTNSEYRIFSIIFHLFSALRVYTIEAAAAAHQPVVRDVMRVHNTANMSD